MGKELHIYLRTLRMHLLAGLEYKGWWFMVLQVLFVCVTDPLGTILMFHRFGGIGSWTLERILLIYALALTSFGLAESCCRGLDYFPEHMLRTGGFDRLLLRPRSLLVQIAASFFHIHRLARPVAGTALIFWALGRLDVVLTPVTLCLLVFALIGGLLTYIGVFVMSAGIAFFTIRAMDWVYIFTNASYQITRIPQEHMPLPLKQLFTFFMPMLVVAYYPAATICGWSEGVPIWASGWAGWLALPAGAAFLGFSIYIWRYGLRHYQSTGS